MLQEATYFGIGWAAWPAFEYAFHRWIFHSQNPDAPQANEHILHHREPQAYNDRTWADTVIALKDLLPKVLVSLSAGATLVLGPRRGLSFVAGLTTHGMLYERAHAVMHNQHEYPTDPKTAHLFRHHMIHHFKNPKVNYGFTSDFFDKLLNTYEEADLVAIPAHMAPNWLKEDIPGYKLVGQRKMAS